MVLSMPWPLTVTWAAESERVLVKLKVPAPKAMVLLGAAVAKAVCTADSEEPGARPLHVPVVPVHSAAPGSPPQPEDESARSKARGSEGRRASMGTSEDACDRITARGA